MKWSAFRIWDNVAVKFREASDKAGKSHSEFLSELLERAHREGASAVPDQSDLISSPEPPIPPCFYCDENESNPLFIKCFYRFEQNLKAAVVPIDDCRKHLTILEEIRQKHAIKSRAELQKKEQTYYHKMPVVGTEEEIGKNWA